jgi:hypothetical protein
MLGVLALALVTAVGMTLVSSAEAKKKHKKGPSVFQAQVNPNAAIPDGPSSGPVTPVSSTITVGKKFKGKVVGDVNVTGIKTTGDVDGAAGDIGMILRAPSGRGVLLLDGGFQGASIGPLTLDDDTFTAACLSPTCTYAPQSLNAPYAGTSNLLFLAGGGTGPLSAFNGLPMKGTWTLLAFDFNTGGVSVLNSWGLQVTPARPVT